MPLLDHEALQAPHAPPLTRGVWRGCRDYTALDIEAGSKQACFRCIDCCSCSSFKMGQ